jgi:hypothetical protein
MFGSNADASVSGGFLPAWAKKIIAAPVKWLSERVKEPLSNMMDKFGNSDLMHIVRDTGKHLFAPVADKIKEMAQTAMVVGKGLFGLTPAGALLNAIKGGGSVREDVRSVAAAYGWDKGAEWNAIDFIVSHESGWDPNAANPNSSARGLFQKMTSIHGPIEKTATGQAKWGLHYIADRYGDPVGARRYWESHGNYSEGGVVPGAPVADNGTMMYDNGGYLPPGLTTVLNLTGKPEPVFTADQFDRMSSGNGREVHYEPHFHKSDLTSRDVAFDLDVEFRRLSRSSTRYSGKS